VRNIYYINVLPVILAMTWQPNALVLAGKLVADASAHLEIDYQPTGVVAVSFICRTVERFVSKNVSIIFNLTCDLQIKSF